VPPTILVAPDSFKGTLSAREVAEASAEGVESAGCQAESCPVADGGEGTMEILVEAFGGRVVERPATDPLGRHINASLGMAGSQAIVEVAQASGLGLLDPSERDPEQASTRGTGELMIAARDLAATSILVAVGGSATVDGGAGAIEAIRAKGGLAGCEVTVLCDVETAFEDAARIYGPQKGASPEAVQRLTARLDQLAAELPRDPRGVPLTGAGGGLSGGLQSAFGAELVPGAEFVLEALDFDTRLKGADAVIVGEGRLDAQTFAGKVVGRIADRCRGSGVPVHAIVGANGLAPAEVAEMGLTSVQVAASRDEIVAASKELGTDLIELWWRRRRP
jgi:glycerate kinase